MQRYPPETDDIERLAEFFHRVDTTELEGLKEVPDVPERELISVSLRLPKRDLEALKRVAAQEGLAPGTFMRWVLHRFVNGLSSRRT